MKGTHPRGRRPAQHGAGGTSHLLWNWASGGGCLAKVESMLLAARTASALSAGAARRSDTPDVQTRQERAARWYSPHAMYASTAMAVQNARRALLQAAGMLGTTATPSDWLAQRLLGWRQATAGNEPRHARQTEKHARGEISKQTQKQPIPPSLHGSPSHLIKMHVHKDAFCVP